MTFPLAEFLLPASCDRQLVCQHTKVCPNPIQITLPDFLSVSAFTQQNFTLFYAPSTLRSLSHALP
jgi:hypothetical protein